MTKGDNLRDEPTYHVFVATAIKAYILQSGVGARPLQKTSMNCLVTSNSHLANFGRRGG